MDTDEKNQKIRKIGIMGGTFDPIHLGHLILAETAFEQFKLEKVLFMPSKNPPHKQNLISSSDQCRLNMVKLAVGDNPHFEVSELELNREGITYTKDTLLQLARQKPNAEYSFLLGADSLFQIESWKDAAVIFQYTRIIIAARNHSQQKEIEEQIQYLSGKYQARIEQLLMPDIDISSSLIRSKIMQRKSVKYYIPASVEQYIKSQKLYI